MTFQLPATLLLPGLFMGRYCGMGILPMLPRLTGWKPVPRWEFMVVCENPLPPLLFSECQTVGLEQGLPVESNLIAWKALMDLLAMEPLLETLRQQFPLALSQVEIRDWQFQLYRPANPDDLISDLEFDRDGRLPYWAELWPSATALASRIATEQGQGRRLLELGCGLGLVCLAAIRAGFEVTATDYYDESLAFTQLNARHNGLPPPATRLVDWRRFPDDLGRFDLVVASDVLFEKPNIPLVAAAFSRTIGPGGRGVLTDPGRPPAAAFPAECERHGLRIVEQGQISLPKPDKPQTTQIVHIYDLSLAEGAEAS